MVIDVVGCSIARTQQDGQRLVGGVEEAGQRMRSHNHACTSEQLRTSREWASTKVASKSRISGPVLRTGHSPAAHARASRLGPGRSDGAESIGIDRIDHPAGRWRGGHRAEESRLIAQHRQVGETVAAVGQGECHVEQDPARIVTPTPTHRRCQGIAQCAGQADESAISASNRVPAWAATPLPSAVTDNDGRGLLRFTLEVPFSGGICCFATTLSQRRRAFPRQLGCVHAGFMKRAG